MYLLTFRKTDDFLNIVRSVVLAQLVISSQSVVFILFVIIMVRTTLIRVGNIQFSENE